MGFRCSAELYEAQKHKRQASTAAPQTLFVMLMGHETASYHTRRWSTGDGGGSLLKHALASGFAASRARSVCDWLYVLPREQCRALAQAAASSAQPRAWGGTSLPFHVVSRL